MANAAATLNGHRATSARVALPKWGAWFADASLDGDVTLTGAVELKIADLTLQGTVLSGGPEDGRSSYRIVGGAGGWGKTVAAGSYANDAGVRLTNVLNDAAKLAGETIDAATVPASEDVGKAWTRPQGPASRVLELVRPQGWYVGEDGVTRLGARATKTLTSKVTLSAADRASGTITVAAESIASILPGIVVDGLEAVDVEHEVSSSGGLRSRIWGSLAAAQSSRRQSALAKLIEHHTAPLKFAGLSEYVIGEQDGERLGMRPVRVSSGMPALKRVPVRAGVAGCKATHMLGSRVLVGFVDRSPANPFVAFFEDPMVSGSFRPLVLEIDAVTAVRLGAGALPVARAGDLAGGVWPILTTQTKVLT